MKKILITGAGSYVGTSVEQYLKQWPDAYCVDTVDMVGEGWKERSFAGYDAVFHVAGIVHQEKAKNDPEQAALYARVNTELAVETARKAKNEGVTVVERNDDNTAEAVASVADAVLRFLALSDKEVAGVRKAAFEMSKKALWENLFTYYQKCCTPALKIWL